MNYNVEIDDNYNIYNIFKYIPDIIGYDCLLLEEIIINIKPKPKETITKIVKMSLDILQKYKININDNI